MQAIPALLAGGGAASGLSAIGTGISAASSLVGVVSSIQSANFQAKVAQNNAAIAEENRKRSINEGALAAQRADLDASQELGALLAKQSASGLSGGTFALQRKSLRELAARDRGTIVYEAEARGARYAQQAQDYQVEASSARSAGKYAALSGVIGAGSSLISGASKYSALKQKELYL